MTSLICNAPFCNNTRDRNHAWCSVHRWEREKFKIKPFKQIQLFNPKKKYKPIYCPVRQKEYNKRYEIKRQEWKLRKRYNLTLNQYRQILEKQNYRCAICHVTSNKENWKNDKTQMFDVDHNHITNEVRGLLCRRCNIFIGYIDKNVHLLDNIKLYLTHLG